MKLRQHIFKAVIVEIITTLFIFSFFYSIFFGLNETLKILYWLLIPIIVGCVAAFVLAWFIPMWFSDGYNFKKWQCVVLMFGLLITGLIAGTISLSFTAGNDINKLSDIFPVLIIFLLFGGLPTLVIGLWLGNRLKEK